MSLTMGNTWIIGVLGDLRAFAALNGMERLSSELEKVADIAQAEIASADGAAQAVPVLNGKSAGTVSWTAGASQQP